MDLGFKDILETIKQELPVIKQAPYSIISAILIFSVVIGVVEYAAFVVEYAAFKEILSHKNELIETLKGQLTAKTVTTAPSAPQSSSSTGNNAPAQVGIGNSVTYGSDSSERSDYSKMHPVSSHPYQR